MAASDGIECDVTVIGGGAAGVAAALEADGAGAKVVVVEQADRLGGTAAISGGGCCMVGTPLQESKGIADSPELAFADWVKCGQGAADEQWARYYIEHSLHDVYFWAQAFGTRWQELQHNEGNSVPRWHRPANNGLGLMNSLIEGLACRSAPRVLTGCFVEKLLANDGKVCGVRALHAGKTVDIRSKTVIVATGGFNSNLDMVFAARPELKGHKVMAGSGPGATGLGHRLIGELGGYFTHMEAISFYVYATPDYRDPQATRGLVFRGTPGYIWVNQQGRRFHDESRSGAPSATPALLKQDPPHAFAILDSLMLGNMQVADPYYRDGDKIRRDRIAELLDNSPYIRTADTIEQLARKIEVDVAAFVAEVEQYNRAFDAGLEREPRFGKPLASCKKFDAPPYRAIQLFPLARKNLGGAKTDMRCRVLDKYFEPIPGLYAAGEVAGMAGGHINGKAGLEGTMMGPSLFSGRVAGGWAAHEAGCGPGFVGKSARPDGP
jgi:flavocytochrome c